MTIFRVPKKLRYLNEKAYTPQIVSIGPFHYGREELKGMESYKESFLAEFCKRTKKKREELLSFINKNSDEVMDSYAGTIQIDRNVFDEMILRDACFIFELFSRFYEKHKKKYNQIEQDYITSTPWLSDEICLDLIMLENQIPYSFLKKLYDFSNPRLCGYERIEFWELSIAYFDAPKTFQPKEEKKIEHFTDLVRHFRLPEDGFKNPKEHVNHLYTATKLDKAGIYFAPAYETQPLAKVGVSEWYCKFIPCFHSVKLKLPLFHIQDDTECIMRNIIALEQCLYPYEAYICNYVFLMSELIDNEEDLDFLVDKKIINNMLSSNREATDLIHNLNNNIMIVKFIYSKECETLNKFCENWYNRAKATLKRVYFKDLWTGSSTVVGFFVLIFSISSTIKSLFFS